MNDVRFGVLGTGLIARAVIPSIQRAAGCSVQAIGSRDERRARALADSLGVPESYGSYDDVLGADLDAVYVTLPNHAHADVSVAVAAAGKHVLCEKPLACSAADARRIADAGTRHGVVVMEAFMYRFHPLWIETKALVAAGAIGDVVAVNTVFSYFNDDPHDIRNRLEVGGGALLDIGCYCIDSARWLFGSEPIGVQAVCRHDEIAGVDVLTAAVMEFPGGGVASFTCGTRVQPDQRVNVIGTAGRIDLAEPSRPFNVPTSGTTPLRVTRGGGRIEIGQNEAIPITATDPYEAQAIAFAAAVRAGCAPPIDVASSVANCAVIDAVRAAAATATRVAP